MPVSRGQDCLIAVFTPGRKQTMNNDMVSGLLEHVSVVVSKNNEIQRISGVRFNMFSLLGVDHYENTHSVILAEFLDPKGRHGLGGHFLSAFVALLPLEKEFLINIEKCCVGIEVPIKNNRRIDILIDDGTCVIVIENKINADEQKDQVTDYYNAMLELPWLRDRKNIAFLYLTKEGDDPSPYSVKNKEETPYLPISYAHTILEWLNQCVRIAVEYPFVRETLRQYMIHIKRLTRQNLEKQQMDDLVKMVCASKETFSAAQAISESFGGCKKALVEKFVVDVFRKVELGEDFNSPEFNSNPHEKDASPVSWKHKLYPLQVRLEFASANFQGLIYGIGWGRDVTQEVKAFGLKIFGKKTASMGWPFWCNVGQAKFRNWDDSFFASLYDESFRQDLANATNGWVKEAVERIPSIIDVMKQAKSGEYRAD